MAKIKDTIYSFWIANQKTFKNVIIIWGPALIAILISLRNAVSPEWSSVIAFCVSYISYFVKNTIENNGFGWIKTKIFSLIGK